MTELSPNTSLGFVSQNPDAGTEKTPSRPYGVQEKYAISERCRLLSAFREWTDDLGRNRDKKASPQVVCDIIDDCFNEFSDWLTVRDPLFRTVFRDRLDPKTIKKLLTCPLDLEVRNIQVGSFRLIDAFLQIVRTNPPAYLRPQFTSS